MKNYTVITKLGKFTFNAKGYTTTEHNDCILFYIDESKIFRCSFKCIIINNTDTNKIINEELN